MQFVFYSDAVCVATYESHLRIGFEMGLFRRFALWVVSSDGRRQYCSIAMTTTYTKVYVIVILPCR